MKRIILTAALTVVPFALATSASADCNDISPGSGDTVTCDGTSIFDGVDAVETRAIDDGSANVTVDIEESAIIDTTALAADAIKLKDDDTIINNQGQIIGGDKGIVGGDDLSVNNQGSISAVDHAIVGENEADQDAVDIYITNGALANTTASIHGGGDAIKGGDRLGILNYGSITADDDVLQADGAAEVTVANFGTIAATDKAITVGVGTDISVFNDGLIMSAQSEAIEAGDIATIENYGVIQGFDDAIQAGNDTYIYNAGIIENTQTEADVLADPTLEAQDAIDIDSGYIANYGTIKSTTNSAIDFDPSLEASIIYNYGTISGTVGVQTDDADLGSQSIVNEGVIEGTSGLALNLGMGNDFLEMYAGSLNGAANFGADDDLLYFDTAFNFDTSLEFAFDGLFDGGADYDVIKFDNLSLGDVDQIFVVGDVVTFSLFGLTKLRTSNWENFQFSDGALSYSEALAASVSLPAAVPLPAGVWLLGSSFAVLGAVARRRRRRQT